MFNNLKGIRVLEAKHEITEMSWDEIQDLMQHHIERGTWNRLVEVLGKPPHVIKHDAFISAINNKERTA